MAIRNEDIVSTIIDDGGEWCIRVCTAMPPGIEGVIVEDVDCFDNIYINGNLPLETQRQAALHELAHHYNHDFDRRCG